MKGSKVKSYICHAPSPMACSTILNQMGWKSAIFMYSGVEAQGVTSLIVSNNDLTTGKSLLTNEVWCSDAESLKEMESMEDGVALAFEADLDTIPEGDVWHINEPNFTTGIKWVIQDRFWGNTDLEFIVPEPIDADLLSFGPEVFGNPQVSALPIGEHITHVESNLLMNTLPTGEMGFGTTEPGLMHILSKVTQTPVELSWHNDTIDVGGSITIDNCEYDGNEYRVRVIDDGLSIPDFMTLISSISHGHISIGDEVITIEDGDFDNGLSIYQVNEGILCFMAIYKSTSFFYHDISMSNNDLVILDGAIDYIIVNADEKKVIEVAKEHMGDISLGAPPGCINVPLDENIILSGRERLNEGLFDNKTLIGEIVNSIHLLESHGFIMESLRVADIKDALENGDDISELVKNDEPVLREFMNHLSRILGIDIGSGWIKDGFRGQIETLVRNFTVNINAMIGLDIDDYILMNDCMSDLGTKAMAELHDTFCLHDKLEYACEVLDLDFNFPTKEEILDFMEDFVREMSTNLMISVDSYRSLASMLNLVNSARTENYLIVSDKYANESLNKIESMLGFITDYVNEITDGQGVSGSYGDIMKMIGVSREFATGTQESFVDMVVSTFGPDAEDTAREDARAKEIIRMEMGVINSLRESSDIDMDYAVDTMENGGGLLPLMALVASMEDDDTIESNTLKDVLFDIMDASFADVLKEMGFIDNPLFLYPEE